GNRIERNNANVRENAPHTSEGLDGGILIVDAVERVTLRYNVIDENGTQGLLIFASEVDCVNNQITRNGENGVLVFNGLFDSNLTAQIAIINTTIAGNNQGIFVTSPGLGALSPEVSIINTIVAENASDLENVELEQVHYSLIGDGTFTGENHNIGGIPAFVDSASDNYRLSNLSPAIDAGTSKLEMLSERDLLGNLRLFDGNGDGEAEIDMGAYEFQGGQPSAIEISPDVVRIQINHTQQFTATVIGTTDQRIRWEVNGVPNGNDEFGTITPDGVYTAPTTIPSTGTITIEAFSLRDSSIRATAQITIVPYSQSPFVLTSDVPIEGEIPSGNPLHRTVFWKLDDQYEIDLPDDAIELTVTLEGINISQDIDLALQRERPVQFRDGQIVADFLSESPRATETITVNLSTNPPLQRGIYYIAVGNFDTTVAKFTLTATVRTGVRPGVAIILQPGEEVDGTIGAAIPPDLHLWDVDHQYQLEVPENTSVLTINLVAKDTGMNLNLAVRFDQKSTIEDGVFIADIKSQNPDGEEQIELSKNTNPPLKKGTYYITVGNFEASPAEFTLVATLSTQTEEFPPWDINQDGVTDILDLVAVGRQFGQPVLTALRADVNGDGVVDILDLVLVSRHFGERSELAAPTLTTLLTSPPAPLLPGEGRESEYGTTSARIWLEPIAGGFKEAGELLRASLKVNVTGGEIYGGKFDFITSPAGLPTKTASHEIIDIHRGSGVKSDQQAYWHSSLNNGAFTYLGNIGGIDDASELAIITLAESELSHARADTMLSLHQIQLVDGNGKQI
ncbi:hypothetical protein IH992_35445, partial [Candidatus Poribacteria bacterium]|nr:hypothetical protein [Candidatus Poribacteria bacterium]